MCAVPGAHTLEIASSALVPDFHTSPAQSGQIGQHHGIDRPGALTAAHDEQMLGTTLHATRRTRRCNGLTDGVARNHAPVMGKRPFGCRQRQKNPGGRFAEQPVGKTRHSILLMQNSRDAEQTRRQQRRYGTM